MCNQDCTDDCPQQPYNKAPGLREYHAWIAEQLSQGAMVTAGSLMGEDDSTADFHMRRGPGSYDYLGSVPIEHYRSYLWLGSQPVSV